MIVRPLKRPDFAQVLCINRSGQPGVAALDERELSRLVALPNAHLIAAGDDGVVGYLLAFPSDAPYDGEKFQSFRRTLNRPFIYIDQVAVSTDRQRSGIASGLYKALEVSARDHGIRLLCCEVNIRPGNKPSADFHSRLGFSPLASMAVADGRDVELLTKTLA